MINGKEKGKDMEDKTTKDMNKDMAQDYETTLEEAKEEGLELPEETLEGIAGGTIPIIDAF